MKNERPIDRIKVLIDWLIENKVVRSIAKFEEICGLSARYVKNLASTEKGNPGVDTIAAIYDVFPYVSLKWLITGKGNMFTVRNEQEMIEKMKLDVVAHEVLSSTNGERNLREALKRALLDHKDDLSAEDKIAILEKLL